MTLRFIITVFWSIRPASNWWCIIDLFIIKPGERIFHFIYTAEFIITTFSALSTGPWIISRNAERVSLQYSWGLLTLTYSTVAHSIEALLMILLSVEGMPLNVFFSKRSMHSEQLYFRRHKSNDESRWLVQTIWPRKLVGFIL